MAEKSALRLARERAGLSRAQLAEKLDTTVHHYWQSEMETDIADPELTARAWKALGQAMPSDGGTPQGKGTPSPREEPGPDLVWVCKLCGHEETQPPFAYDPSHICPKRAKTGTGKRQALVRKID